MALRSVAAVITAPVPAFELGVVSEVFGLDRTADGLPGFDFAVCAVEEPPIATSSGFSIDTPHRLERLTGADLIAVPGWPVDCEPPTALVEALHAAVARGARVMSVCSGAFLLAAAGLLDGRRATTHWKYAERLAARFPRIDVDPNVLYIDEAAVLTSAGTAAGIDLCLHIVRQEFGVAVASAIARRMIVPPHREGGQAQYIETPLPAEHRRDDLGPVLAWAQAHLDRPVGVATLARRAHMSDRTFARRFAQAMGTTPHRWLVLRRLELAQRMLEETALDVEEVARRSGFGSAATLRHHFARWRGTSPVLYRRLFRGERAA